MKYTAVLADDDEMVTTMTEMLLTSEGINVLGKAKSRAELLELIARHAPNIFITDNDMPERDAGINAIRKLRQNENETPGLLISGRAHTLLSENPETWEEKDYRGTFYWKPKTADLRNTYLLAKPSPNSAIVGLMRQILTTQ